MKINLSIFIFLVIAVIAGINDILIYMLKMNYNICLMISICVSIIVSLLLIKKNKIKIINNFEKKDLIVLMPYILINSMLFLSCDEKLDTLNYHIYIQKNFFNDKINFDYLPYCGFFFPLGDRMSYIFRYFLGYRLGTVLSFYTVIILFYQMKSILVQIHPDISRKNRLFFSSLVLLTVTPNWRSASYHVDNFSMILILEILHVFIKKEDIILNKKYLYYIFLILGIATAIKITNAFIGSTILLIMIIDSLIKNNISIIKEIKLKDIVVCLILLFFPCIIYMIDNYLQTGNPIFPFLNNIFKSEYYANVNGSDNRFGIPNLLYAFIWPIVVTINPLYGFDYKIIDPLWGIGYIVCIVNIVFINKKRNTIWKLSLTGVILSIIWAIFLNGYTRYALVLPILFYIVIASNIIYIYKYKYKKLKITFLECFIFFVLSILLMYCVMQGIYIILLRTAESYEMRIDFRNYYVGEKIYEIDGVWGSIAFNSAMIDLIRNPNTPIYNLDITRSINSSESEYSKNAQEEMAKKLKNKKIFTVTSESLFKRTLEFLEESGFKIIGEPVEYVNSKLQNRNDTWYILEIVYK